ncbi:head assembly [Escherichia phage IMM-002]|uniref:Capsid and scaffold protein n=1 Tax=Escherichia phage IMM-002 TaxID=2041760 RepID=A0A384X8B4_9CAUD|nr:head assembly [Escherichia phage IMM-002]ATI17017.1 capsid and scaffold protein [Escherichia phage IMM-002]
MSQSVYAEFGVSPNAITGSVEDLNEHQQSMLEKDVAVRDGDDAITFKQLEAEQEEATEEDENVEETEEEEEVEETEDSEGQDQEFIELGDTPKELTESVSALDENEAAFDDMVSAAVEAGKVTADDIATIKAEYAANGELSEASYAKLAEAGYTKRFVDSFVRGQEALAEQYAAGVIRYAGGAEQFNRILSHLEANDKSTKEALESAIIRKDLVTAKAILNLAGRNLGKARGVQPQRTITTQGKPAVSAPKVETEGFSSKADMVKAMSDPRYLRDAKYTMDVRAKVAASSL